MDIATRFLGPSGQADLLLPFRTVTSFSIFLSNVRQLRQSNSNKRLFEEMTGFGKLFASAESSHNLQLVQSLGLSDCPVAPSFAGVVACTQSYQSASQNARRSERDISSMLLRLLDLRILGSEVVPSPEHCDD
jgi:hypothetical protein